MRLRRYSMKITVRQYNIRSKTNHQSSNQTKCLPKQSDAHFSKKANRKEFFLKMTTGPLGEVNFIHEIMKNAKTLVSRGKESLQNKKLAQKGKNQLKRSEKSCSSGKSPSETCVPTHFFLLCLFPNSTALIKSL